MFKVGLTSLIAFLFPTLLFAGNSHEHFQLLPAAENFLVAAPQIFGLDHDAQKLPSLFKDYETLTALLRESHFQQNQIDAAVNEETFPELTLTDLCSKLGGDRKSNLAKLLTIQEKSLADKTLAKQIYVTIEDLRRSLVLLLDTQTVTAVFNDYFAHDPLADRDRVEATVSSVYFGESQIGKLRKIKEVAKAHGSQLDYLYSIRRSQLGNYDFQSLENLIKLHEEGLIVGIDVTESMSEATQRAALDYDSALLKLFDFASKENLLLKLHSFEGDNTGPFYDSLYKVFFRYDKPLRLRIGHINKMTPQWLKILNSNPFIQVSLDANLESGLFLQEGTSVESIGGNIRDAERLGLPVSLGSDGRGMNNDATYSRQKDILTHLYCSEALKFAN